MNASVKRYVKAVLNLIISVLILLAVLFLLPKALVYFLPFIAAWLIACIAAPLVRFLEQKLKIKRKAGSAVVIVLVIGTVALLLYLLGATLVREAFRFSNEIPELWKSAEREIANATGHLSKFYDRLSPEIQDKIDMIGENVGEWSGDVLAELASPTITAVGNVAKQIPTVIIGIVICLLSSYFFVAEKNDLRRFLTEHMPKSLLLRYRIIKNSLGKAVGGYMKAQLVIEFWVYLILVTGFFILQVNYPFWIAFGIAILDILPFFGTGTAMVPWAVIKLLNGEYPFAIGITVLWAFSQLVRQIIQPKILGDSVGMPPIPTLFLLYIGYMEAGVIGMIIAVPVGLIFWTMYKEGLFATTLDSAQILICGLNRFRHLTEQDKEVITAYKKECEEEEKRESGNEKQKF
ncbi:MAG: sporulation integral membrane protein YtvI [Lachnospiraceae bacterium]